ERYDGTVPAQKLLSCVLRIRQKSDMSVGLAHVAAVLVGSGREKLERLGHTSLSTYGIGRDKSRGEWQTIGRGPIALGVPRRARDRSAVVEVTPAGREALARRTPVTLTCRAAPSPADQVGGHPQAPGAASPTALPCDEMLLSTLRRLRKDLADARDVPAF